MDQINLDLIRKIEPLVLGLRAYHRYETDNINAIPKSGKALLVLNHSLATYDIALLFHEIMEKRHRICRPLVDRLFYKVPFLKDLMNGVGATEGSPESAKNLLRSGEIVAVAPGGMKEALRGPNDKYKVMWESRKGFAKLAIETGAPIIVAVCPNADNMYDLVPNPLTNWMYKKFRIPLFIAKGLGKSPLPKPVKLVHYLSKPIKPPQKLEDPAAFKRQVNRYHKKVLKVANELIEESLEKQEAKFSSNKLLGAVR